jgi:hypothetical protein
MPENTKIGALWLKERGPFATGTLDDHGERLKTQAVHTALCRPR